MGIDTEKSLLTAAELRSRAEEQLNAKEAGFQRTDDETHRLLHELQVHQIQLEMQNAELRQARNDLEKSLEKYAELYDFAPVGYFTLDQAGTIRSANLTGATLLGIERSRLLGLRFGLFVTAETGSAFSSFLGRVFTRPAKESCEVTLAGMGNLPRFMQIEALAAASGQECRAAVIDITERKRAEAEIRRLASFPLLNPNPVLELDAYGQMTFCNPATKRILEKAGDSYSGNPLLPQDMPVILNSLRDKKSAKFSREVEINGSIFEEHIYVEPPFQSVRIYSLDCTDRKRAEEEVRKLHSVLAARAIELEAANTELEAFNCTVAHDLRKPLTIIHGYCQVLLGMRDNQHDEQTREYIREIYSGALRMNRLISTLIDFSRATRLEIRPETFDLSALAKAEAAELILAEPGRRVAFRIAEGITANGDAGLWRIVLDNLIGNAWKFTGHQEDTLIEFGLTEVDGKPACFVRDNGPGFDMAYAHKLFVPFQRIPGMDVEGCGIGLATVERIVRRHGGRVWAESEPGRGATFLFTLE